MTDPTPRDPVRDPWSELERLAKAVGPQPKPVNGGVDVRAVSDWMSRGFDFRDACTPDTVLRLIEAARVAAADESRAALVAAIPDNPYIATDSRCYSCNVMEYRATHEPDCDWVKAQPVAHPPSVAGEAS